jgi:hypothetical protein|tara:strand:+ start:1041 stop:1514 length:474 start_codon:yes stop_codon:yes gene_type:complete
MAVTTINLSDPISTLVTKTNTISTDLGDKATLNTTATTDLVTAINEINTKVVAIDTDAEIGAKVEAFFAGSQLDVGGINADSADFDSATITTLTSTTGTIATLTSTNATIDSAQFTNINLDGIGNIGHLKSLQIKNSSGTVVLAGYLLSTSNTAGTL